MEATDKGIINLSLGSDFSQIVNNAANGAVDDGHLLVVAAGNDDTNVADVSPASAKKAITVAATNRKNMKSAFSNYGKAVDLFAPGVGCKVADLNSNKYTTNDGTSFSAPLVSGVAACIQSQYDLNFDEDAPKKITKILLNATSPEVTPPTGTTNRLLYWKNCE
ncbi:alkaline protease-like protein [Leptotrombidium deliense]|uniref:Alkaline protease-like protein n=1 Tax=Leptotrombidium deliense TaxID=299467 RepID=A0A443SBC0_9ACAR|nr:alkaline protease-like protein [Leptotrombidium deliense]